MGVALHDSRSRSDGPKYSRFAAVVKNVEAGKDTTTEDTESTEKIEKKRVSPTHPVFFSAHSAIPAVKRFFPESGMQPRRVSLKPRTG
jgi:DNA/RNA-binding domain of Phe-tRNA-synthetase-like protein